MLMVPADARRTGWRKRESKSQRKRERERERTMRRARRRRFGGRPTLTRERERERELVFFDKNTSGKSGKKWFFSTSSRAYKIDAGVTP